ncbi:MAG: hypothetical protein U1E39_02835 [Planctomycetota bacterium]
MRAGSRRGGTTCAGRIAARCGRVVVAVAVAVGACAAGGCGRGEDARADAWDDGGAPDAAGELRVLAPSGRLAPSAWDVDAWADGRSLGGASTRSSFVVAVPVGARRIVVAAPGCVPVETPPADDGRTIVRLRPGPRVTLKVVGVPMFSDPLTRLFVVLEARGSTTSGPPAPAPRSMAATALVDELGFSSAGARVPADGVVTLHVPVAGDYAVQWAVDRANRRAGFQDGVTVVTVPADGRTDPVEVRVPPAVGAFK